MGKTRSARFAVLIICTFMFQLFNAASPGIALAVQSYVGEIRMFAGNFAPQGWRLCDGQLLQIAENDTLFSLIGTTYGGDGMNTFALPDLRGRAPIHMGNGFTLGETGGTETVTLNLSQIPAHDYGKGSSNAGSTITPQPGAGPAKAVLDRQEINIYSDAAGAQTSIVPMGSNQPHENMQPYLAINYIISLDGIYPTRN